MKRALLAALLVLVAAPEARATLPWTSNNDAAGHTLTGLSIASGVGTSAVTLAFVTPGHDCLLKSTDVDGNVVCGANPVASITVTDPISNTGTSTAPIFGLKFTNTDVILNGGGALEIAAYTGAIVKAAGATATTFGAGGPMTVLANGTSGSAAPTFIGPATSGQVFQALSSSSLGFGPVQISSIPGLAPIASSGSANDLSAGTIPTLRLPAFTGGDVTSTGGSLVLTIGSHAVSAAKLQQFAGESLVGVTGSSTADVAAVTATADNQVFQRLGGTVQAHTLDFSQLTGAVTPTQTNGLSANWTITNTRWYCVDGVGGDDTKIGYSDLSEADCGTKALKTIAALAAIFPHSGTGHIAKVTIAQGTYTDGLIFLNGASGYQILGVIGTATKANAGAVAFDGSASTDLFAGAVTVSGLNAGGYTPTGSPTTTAFTLQKNGGGAASLPAEPAAPLGQRIRFDIATSTTALQGICKDIVSVSGGNAITINSPLSVAPSTSDVFYIEKAGVIVGATDIASADTQGLAIGGFDMGVVNVWSGTPVFIFSSASALSVQSPGSVGINRIWQGNFSGSRALGGGLIVSGNVNNLSRGGGNYQSVIGGTFQGTVELIDPSGATSFADATVFAQGVAVHGGSMAVQGPDFVDSFGGATSTTPLRIIGPGTYVGATGGLVLRGTGFHTRVLTITGQGAHPAMVAIGNNRIIVNDPISGSSGNTDVGLDLTNSTGSRFDLLTTPTVTGTAGDVRLCNGTIVTWAQAAAGVVDACGNVLGGSTSSRMTVTPAGGTVLPGGTLTVPNLVGPGFAKTDAGGLFSVDTTTYVPTSRTLTMTAPMTCNGSSSCNLGSNITIATPVFAGGAAGLVPPSSGSTSVFLRGDGTYAAPAGSGLPVPGSTGLLVWNGSSTLGRTLTNGDGTISFGNPDGVAANPEIHVNAIPESKVTSLTADLAARVLTSSLTTCTGVIEWTGTVFDCAPDLTVDPPLAIALNHLTLSNNSTLVVVSSVLGRAHVSGDVDIPAGSNTATIQPHAVTVGDIAPSGTVGWVLTTVSPGTVAWQAQSAPGIGTVTNVSGTTGQINVVNNTSTPVVSLAAKGPGSGAYGGSGIAGFSLDAFGGITAVTAANYQAAITFPPAGELAVSTGSGLTGDTQLTYSTATDLLAAGDGVAINGASIPGNVYLIGAAITSSNRDRVQLFVGGGTLPSTGTTGDSTLVAIIPSFFGGGTAVSAGVTSGIYSSLRVSPATYSGTGQVITEAAGGYFEQPVLSGVSGLSFALHAVGTSLITGDFGATGTVAFDSLGGSGPGIVLNDTFGDIRSTGNLSAGNLVWDGAGNVSTTGATSTTILLTFREQDTTAACSGWIAYLNESGAQYNCTTNNPSTTPIEFPTPFVVKHVRMLISMTSDLLVGIDTYSFVITRNGTALGTPVFTFTSSVPAGVYDSGEVSVSGALNDVWGIKKIGSGGTNPSSMHATISMTLRGN